MRHPGLTIPLLGLLLCAGSGRAQAPEQATFALEYAAPAACPDEPAFVAAILARTPAARRAPPELAAVQLRAEVAEDSSTLTVTLADGSSRREIRGATCDEVVASMAVIAAMVLETPPESRLAVTDAPVSVPVSRAEPATPPAPPVAPAPPKPAEQDVAPRPAPVQRPRGAERHSLRWSVSAGAAVETAVAPTPPPIATLGAELLWQAPRVWSPSLGAQFLISAEAVEESDGGEARFRLVAGRVNACPFRLNAGSSPRVSPCLTFDAGGLRGQGAGDAENAETVWAPWLAAGLALRGELDFTSVLGLEALASARLLAYDNTFIFRPDSLVYDVPLVSFGLGLGISVRP